MPTQLERTRAKTEAGTVSGSHCAGGRTGWSPEGKPRGRMSLCHHSVIAKAETALDAALSLPTSYGQKQMQTQNRWPQLLDQQIIFG